MRVVLELARQGWPNLRPPSNLADPVLAKCKHSILLLSAYTKGWCPRAAVNVGHAATADATEFPPDRGAQVEWCFILPGTTLSSPLPVRGNSCATPESPYHSAQKQRARAERGAPVTRRQRTDASARARAVRSSSCLLSNVRSSLSASCSLLFLLRLCVPIGSSV